MPTSPSRLRTRPGFPWLLGLTILTILAPRVSPAQTGAADWLSVDTGPRTTDEGPSPGVGTRILMYPVNRIADLLDPIAFDFGFGFIGVHANAHATRMAQFGAGFSTLNKFGIDGREIGLFNETRSEISILPFSIESYNRDGTIGTYRDFDTKSQREQLYREVRDYFEVGGAVTAGIFGASADVKPRSIFDFVVGWAGFDPEGDDYPLPYTRDRIFNFGESERRSIQRMVVVTSRVVDTPRVGSEAESGVAVYHNRANGEFFWGNLGRWFGSGGDSSEESDLNQGLGQLGYALAADLAERFENAYGTNSPLTEIIPASTFDGVADRRVRKKIGDETVVRLPNYPGLCEAYNADAICDLRILEWSVFQHRPGVGLRIRLNVELKIIKYPENRVLVDISELIYDVEKVSDTGLDDFMANSSRLVRTETRQALDIMIPQFIDRLFERQQ